MPTIRIISLDYDGCGAILSTKNTIGKLNARGQYEPGRDKQGRLYGNLAGCANAYPGFLIAIEEIQKVLNDYIMNPRRPYVKRELYVGSNRQSKHWDDLNANRNGNGSCFTSFRDYALEKGIDFNPLLYADVVNDKALEPIAMLYSIKDEPETHHPECDFDELKDATLIAQLQDIARRHPDDEIEFVFIDDDNKNVLIHNLFEKISEAYDNPILRPTLPKAIHITLQKFDWFPILEYATKGEADRETFKAAAEQLLVDTSATLSFAEVLRDRTPSPASFFLPPDIAPPTTPTTTPPAEVVAASPTAFFSVPAIALPNTVVVEQPISCFTEQQKTEIKNLICLLQKEINSFWPYPNKDRKANKIQGLREVLELTNGVDINTEIAIIEKKYPDLSKSKISTRTRTLLDSLKSDLSASSRRDIASAA